MTVPLLTHIVRELEVSDILELDKSSRDTKAPLVKALRERHHRLARLLAEGVSETEAAIQCDYSQSRVSILKADPSFQALLAHYRTRVDEVYLGMHQRLSDLSQTAAAILADRLEDEPEQFSNNELAKLVQIGADRTGHGPSSTTKLEIGSGFAARLDAARRRLAERTIDITPE